LRRDGQQFLVLAGILAGSSLVAIFAGLSVATVLAGLTSWSGRSALASTASADFGVGLTSRAHESAERGLGSLAGATTVALMDVQHLLPHIARTRLAELDLALYAGLQGLDVVEDQREGQQAGGHCHRAEHDRDECDHAQRRIRIHLGFFHLFVFTHCSNGSDFLEKFYFELKMQANSH
jgi:hypothetical protein